MRPFIYTTPENLQVSLSEIEPILGLGSASVCRGCSEGIWLLFLLKCLWVVIRHHLDGQLCVSRRMDYEFRPSCWQTDLCGYSCDKFITLMTTDQDGSFYIVAMII